MTPVAIHPDARELKVLRELSGGEPGRVTIPGVGEGTMAGLIAKGWIVEAEMSPSGQRRYVITPDGDAAKLRGLAPKAPRTRRLQTLAPRLSTLSPRLGKLP